MSLFDDELTAEQWFNNFIDEDVNTKINNVDSKDKIDISITKIKKSYNRLSEDEKKVYIDKLDKLNPYIVKQVKIDYSKYCNNHFKFKYQTIGQDMKPIEIVVIDQYSFFQTIFKDELKIDYSGQNHDISMTMFDLYHRYSDIINYDINKALSELTEEDFKNNGNRNLNDIKDLDKVKDEIEVVWKEFIKQFIEKYNIMNKNIQKRIKLDNIDFESLWYIYKPGTFIVIRKFNTSIVTEITSCWYGSNNQKDESRFTIKSVSYKLNDKGKIIENELDTCSIDNYSKVKSIKDLDVKILLEEDKKKYTDRGEKLLKILANKQYHYCFYDGMYYYSVDNKTKKKTIKSRIMIDYKMFNGSSLEEDEVDIEEKYFLLSPFVRGYDIHQYKVWATFNIENISEIEFTKDAFDRLIIPGDDENIRKNTIVALLDNFSGETRDVVQNKNSGLITLLHGPPGVGKCLGRDTPILMYDGTIKMVQDIVVGDKLMGDDFKYRNVLSCCTGSETMYKIELDDNSSFIVNESHIISLKYTQDTPSWLIEKYDLNKDDIIDIPLLDYLSLSDSIKKNLRSFRSTRISFPKKKLVLDPYIVGCILGHESIDITVDDSFFENYSRQLTEYGATFTKNVDSEFYNVKFDMTIDNSLTKFLKSVDFKNTHIPHEYKTASYNDRCELILSMVMLDFNETYKNSHYISVRSETLADDILFVTRSIGMRCQKTIRNDMFLIEVVGLEPPVEDFTVTKLDVDDYYGFTIDGNHRFVLGNFIVTHNTMTAEISAEHLKRPIYRVTAGELGLTSDSIDENFMKISQLCVRWNAIVLLDEADVFLEARDSIDIDRNAIVGTFLKILEYFNGIIFMTTNRVSNFDDAVHSRIHITLEYSKLDRKSRVNIWNNMLKSINQDNVGLYQIEYSKLNGRQLRTIFNVAMSLAKRDGTELLDKHVEMAFNLNGGN